MDKKFKNIFKEFSEWYENLSEYVCVIKNENKILKDKIDIQLSYENTLKEKIRILQEKNKLLEDKLESEKEKNKKLEKDIDRKVLDDMAKDFS